MSPAYSPETIVVDQMTSLNSPEPTSDSGTEGANGTVRIVLVSLLILGIVVLTVWKIHRNFDEQNPTDIGNRRSIGGSDRAISVKVVGVERKMMPIFLTCLGTVTAYNSVTIRSRVDGELIAVNVREGQAVKKGQLLAQIDPKPYVAALAQAEGQLAKDTVTANYANAEAARYSALFDAGVIAQNSQQLQASNAGQSSGAVEADKAMVRAATVNLAYTRITSPIDGVVGLRQTDPGNIVHANDASGLLLITQVQPISVTFTLPEDQLPQVQQARRKNVNLGVEVYDRSRNIKLASGKFLTLDNVIDTATGTDKAKALFDNKDGGLFPNQFVNVKLVLQQSENALVIPASAVQTGSQGNFVYVMKRGDPPKVGGAGHSHKLETRPVAIAKTDRPDDKPKYYVELRPIVTVLVEGTQVVVGNGVADGEQVVVDGVEKLKNGSRVLPEKGGAEEAGNTGAPVDEDKTGSAPSSP